MDWCRSPAAGLLAAGVPLTLLLDLAEPAGPDSIEIMRVENVLADLALERKVIVDLVRWESERDAAAETA